MEFFKGKRVLTGTILAIAAVLFLVLNLTSGVLFKALRLDLTSNKLYSLSTGTKEILGELDEPITLRFYYSRKVAKVNPYLVSFAARIEDMLVQYQRASKGKIKIEIIDPEPFSPEEDNAVNFGLQGVPADNTGTELYMGIVGTNALNQRYVIPFMQPNREVNLEYDITQLIYNLAHPQARLVGVMSSLPLAGRADARPWVVWQQMAQIFALQPIEIDAEEIPPQINTLMVVEPSSFTKDALRAIDDFVMRGGHLIMFVDPFTEVIGPQAASLNRLSKDSGADFNRLLNAWGVELTPNKVVGDRALAKSVRLPHEGREITIRYPLWMDFVANNFTKEDVLSVSMERITMATPGVLNKTPDSTSEFLPLIRTTNEATLVDTDQIAEVQQNVGQFINTYTPTGDYTVAGRISGKVNSAFSDATVENANIIVVADADMLFDHFWVNIQNVMGQEYATPNASNGNFVLSALDNLSGSNALISIRNRGGFVRPFETLRSLELKSQEKYRESEVQLQEKLEITKQKLADLERQKQDGSNSVVLNVAQKQEQEAFRAELVETRKQLREVRRNLNREIESVEFKVKFFSIAFIPLLIALGGLAMWGWQIQREIKTRKAVCKPPKP